VARIRPGDLQEVLAALGEQLALAECSVHIVVIGGSGLVAIDAVSRPTRDVDVVALFHDGSLISSAPLPEPLIAAAQIIARDFQLAPDWLNPAPTSLLEIGSGLPAGFAERMITREFGPVLTVSFASRIDQIHLKLYAAADRDEPRDFDDLRALEPTVQELKAAAVWARTHNAPGPFDEALARTLRTFGVEDEGRDA
jgi:hypothetical protein